jgi:hypothetical protein
MKNRHIPVILCLLLACTSSHNPTEAPAIYTNYPYPYINQVSQQINYTLSTQTANVIEIRVWIKEELKRYGNGVFFKTDSTGSYLQKVKYYARQDTGLHFRNYIVDSAFYLRAVCDQSVTVYIDTLLRMGFDTLPSQSGSIKEEMADGVTYVLEVKNGMYYQAIDYNTPQRFKDRSTIAFKNMLRVLSNNGKNFTF